MFKPEGVCNECPWRRDSLPGFMGGYDPVDYAQTLSAGLVPSCHMRSSDKKDVGCFGAATVMRNKCQLPRNPEMREVVQSVSVDVAAFFKSEYEFINHHGDHSEEEEEDD